MSGDQRSGVPEGVVLDRGTGPAVLLLHGAAPGTTAAENFAELIPALSDYRVLAPDLLGFGASPKDLDVGPVAWTRQAWQVLDRRDIDQVTVLGNSAGARVAIDMAIEQPGRVHGLVLLSTRMTPTSSTAQALLRAYTPSMEGMAEVVRTCFASATTTVSDALVRRRYELSAQPGAHDAMQRAFAALGQAGGAASAGDLTDLDMPAMLMHGRDDRIVPSSDGALLAELLPHADLHVFADAGHWFQNERASAVNGLVRDFLTRYA